MLPSCELDNSGSLFLHPIFYFYSLLSTDILKFNKKLKWKLYYWNHNTTHEYFFNYEIFQLILNMWTLMICEGG